jgi:nitrile hydratase
MNGGQDLGGTHGHGPVRPEPNEPVFHGEWEKRAFALTLAMGMPGGWNIDMGRFARENRPPGEYLAMSYYQIWFAALEHMIKERGLVLQDEIDAGHSLRPPKPVKRTLSPERTDRARDQHQSRVRSGRQSARTQYQSPHPYAAAALCPRTHRHHRARRRLSCFSRQQRDRRRRKSEMALHRAVRRARIVGA